MWELTWDNSFEKAKVLPKKETLVHTKDQTERRNIEMDEIAWITKNLTKTVLKPDEKKYSPYLVTENFWYNPFIQEMKVYSNSAKVYSESAKEIYKYRYTILWYTLFFVPWISIWKWTAQIVTKILSKTKVGTEVLIRAKNGYSYIAKKWDNSKIYFRKLGKNINRKFYKTIVEKTPIIRRIWMLKWVKVWNFNVKRINNAWWNTFTYKLCDSTWKLISNWKTNFITFNNIWWKITFSWMNASWPATWMWSNFLRTILNQFKWQTVYTTKQIKPSVNLMLERMWFSEIITKKWQKLDKIIFNRTSVFVPYWARPWLLQDLLNKQHLQWYTITQLGKDAIVKWNIHTSFYNAKYKKLIQ